MNAVAVALSPSPFARAPEHLNATPGTTIRAVLLEAVRSGKLALDDLARATVYVDGAAIPRDQALGLVLAEGQVVNIAVEPLGGGGGRKDPLQIILQIAVIAVAAWVGGPAGAGLGLKSAFWRTVASAATLTLGNMALAALFAPDVNSQAKANDRYALQSAQNQFRPWGSFPLALGEVVVAPDLAVKTYTRTVGDESWINGILALHHGPCEVSDLKIGDTLASSMGAGEAQFAYHLTPGPRTFSIYPNDTDQVDFQEELQATTTVATPLVRQASAEGERFEFDFFLPMGLHFAKDDGRILSASVSVGVERRQIDENGAPIGSWANATTVALSSTTRDPWRITRAVSLPMGRYEFRFTRSLKPDDNTKRRDAIYLTAIRSVAFRKPVRDETLSLIEFSIRATALNQGALAPITCRITPKVPTWTGGAWGAPVASSNPAALVRWLMTGPAPAKPLAPTQADARLRTWSALCDAYDWKAHIYLTESRQQDAVLAMLGQAGRAGLFWDGTQLAATPWVEKPAPRQLFAGENLADHRWSIAYPEPVHALRVEFANLDQGGEPDELFVYADGYAAEADPEEGLLAATLIEALRLEGQNTPERAYRDGRWELGRRLHQRRIDTWSCGLEHLVSSYGDRVRLAYGRVDGGIGARVRCRRWGSGETAGKVIGLRLDQPVEMVEGQAYALDLRLASGVVASVPIVTTPGVVREVVFATPREPDSSPAAGGRVAFGVETRVSEDVEIIGVEPGEGLTARLTGIRYVAPLLMAGETGPIPPLPNRLSRDRAMDPPAPSLLGPPQIEANGVRINWSMPPWRGSPITGYACRWRALPEEGQAVSWTPLPDPGAGAGEIFTPPMAEVPAGDADRTRIQVEIRAMTASGRVSPPLMVTVVEPALPPPADDDWTVEPRTPGTGGVVQPGLTVSGTVSNDRVAEVIVEYGLAPEEVLTGPDDPPLEEQIAWSPWPSLRAEAAITADIVGLEPEADYYVAVRELTRQGAAPSPRLIKGPVTTPNLVADDTRNVGGEPIDDFLTRMGDAADAAADALSGLSGVPGQISTAVSEAEGRVNTRIDGLDLDDIAGLRDLSDDIYDEGTGLIAQVSGVQSIVNAAPRTYVQSSEPAGPRRTGDQWVDTSGAANVLKTWSGSAWVTQAIPAGVTIYAQTSEPTGTIVTGSIWYDTDDNNRQRRWNGSAWVEVTDPRIANAISRVVSLEEAVADPDTGLSASATRLDLVESEVSGRPRTYVQSSAPGGTRITGDLWIDTTGGLNVPKGWNGTAWVAQSIPAGITVYAQDTPPTAPIVTGSLWYDTDDDNRPHRWNGSTWVALPDGRYTSLNGRVVSLEETVADFDELYASASRVDIIEAEIEAARDGDIDLAARFTSMWDATVEGLDGKASATALDALSLVVSGKPRTYVQSTEPAGPRIVGDLWIDTTGGVNTPKAWNGSAWVVQSIPAGITVYAQATAPTAPIVTGSIWYDTTNGNRQYRWNGSAWVAVDDARIGTLTTNVGTLTTAVADLSTGKADVSRVATLEAARLGVRNLVRRGSTAGATATVDWGASGWGTVLSGSARTIALPPLKQNTPYSLTFRARVATGAATPMDIDLFPDTLPQTQRNITTTEQQFTWEGITSAHADMTGSVSLRFFRQGGLPGGTTIEITDIMLVQSSTALNGWVAAVEDGYVRENELSGRITTVEEVTIGPSSTLEVTATQLGLVKTEVELARDGSTTLSAQLSDMRTATSTVDSAMATHVANLVAAIRTKGNEVRNSTGTLGKEGWSGASWSAVDDQAFGPRFECNAATGTQAMIQATGLRFAAAPSEWFTLQADFFRHASSVGGGVYGRLAWYNAGGSVISYSARIGGTAAQAYGAIQTAEVQAPANTVAAAFQVFIEDVTTNAGHGVRRIKVARERLSQLSGWTDEGVPSLQQAQITSIQSVAVTADGIARALVGLLLDVNGFVSGWTSENDGSSASVKFLADVFEIVSPGGGARAEYSDGIWYFYDASNTTRVSLGKPHGGSSHGLVLWCGPASVTKGTELKGDAYVYVSMNETGGGRFGGSAVPTGGGGQGPGGSVENGTWTGAFIADGTWTNVATKTMPVVPGGGYIQFDGFPGLPTVSAGTFNGEIRVIQTSGGAVIAGPQAFSCTNGSPIDPSLSLGGPAVATGSVGYSIQVRRASGSNTLTFSGNYNLSALLIASTTQVGFLSPEMAGLIATAVQPAALASGLSGKANASHTHAVGDITGLANSATITAASGSGGSETIVRRNSNGSIFLTGLTMDYAASGNAGIFFGPGGGHFMRRNGTTNIFNFSHEVTAPTFTPTCDAQLKANRVQVVDTALALAQVRAAELWTYDRVEDDVHALGFLAQQIMPIQPLWVSGGALLDPEGPPGAIDGCVVDEDGETLRTPYGLDLVAVCASLFGAVQQLADQADAQAARIETLEAQLAGVLAHLNL